MNATSLQLWRKARQASFLFAVVVIIVVAARPAPAQWRAVDAQNAFSGYNNAFLYLEPDSYSKVFVTTQKGTTHEGFWTQAEEIAVAEDAYYANPTTANKNEVQALCDGFVNYVHPATNDMWTSDLYDDDLMWAVISFARAYSITGTTRWLTDAENNFNAVYNRGLLSNGGIVWYAKGCTGHPITGGCDTTYENSAANWTFVIAGDLLYNVTGNSTYFTEKNSVYIWAKANLYDSTTGEIYDAPGVSGQYTYNYGIAMIAGSYQGSNVMVPNIATYVFNDLTNYSGTSGGYNILPNYGQGDLNNSGFNGILMRGVGIANSYGYIPAAVMDAAQANMNYAWSERNGTTTLVWNDWEAATPSTGTYSWDDSAALAGLLDIPPTAQ